MAEFSSETEDLVQKLIREKEELERENKKLEKLIREKQERERENKKRKERVEELERENKKRKEREEELERENKEREEELERENKKHKEREEELERENKKRKEREEELERENKKRKEREEELERELAQNQQKAATLAEYLHDYHHHVFGSFRISTDKKALSDSVTNPHGRRYPLRLRPWTSFADERNRHFSWLSDQFGNRRVFAPTNTAVEKGKETFLQPAAVECDTVRFGGVALEAPILRIIEELGKIGTGTSLKDEFGYVRLEFASQHSLLEKSLPVSQEENVDGDGGQEWVRRTVADGIAYRIYEDEGKEMIFVIEYKTAHKLLAANVRQLLSETLLIEVAQRNRLKTTTTDEKLKARQNAQYELATALIQVYDYMLGRGVGYGYVAGGDVIIFLHVEWDDLHTLYYHVCAPKYEPCGKDGLVLLHHTPTAQLVSFCLLTSRYECLQGSRLEALRTEAKAQIRCWPHLYDEAGQHVESEESHPLTSSSQSSSGQDSDESFHPKATKKSFPVRSYATRQRTTTARGEEEEDGDDQRQETQATASSSGTEDSRRSRSHGNSHDIFPSIDVPPTKPYCTQACLLGLKRKQGLDEKCPNVAWHRVGPRSMQHAVDAGKLAALLEAQLGGNAYDKCVAVDPCGVAGKIGSIGALFKVEVAKYGYTFVAKGTQSAHLGALQHESRIYGQLDRLQGEVVPVYLGIINIARGHILPGGARVFHLLLMSWCGNTVTSSTAVTSRQTKDETCRSFKAVLSEGVHHRDEHASNLLWNEELRRVMLVDFDRAVLLPPPTPKHKQALRKSQRGKKYKARSLEQGGNSEGGKVQ